MALTDVDRNLLQRCLKRDAIAWRDFVDRFSGLFVHVIRHSAQSRSVQLSNSDMDDLCAEVFLAILADDFAILRRFKEESSLATYLAVISRRIVVREIVRRRMSETLGHSKLGNSSVDGLSNESADAQRIDNRDLVERMLDGLPEREAAVVRQFHLEGLTYHEISHKLGVPENSIGPTLTRARERLRRAVAQA